MFNMHMLSSRILRSSQPKSSEPSNKVCPTSAQWAWVWTWVQRMGHLCAALTQMQRERPAYVGQDPQSAKRVESWWSEVIRRTAIGAGADSQSEELLLPTCERPLVTNGFEQPWTMRSAISYLPSYADLVQRRVTLYMMMLSLHVGPCLFIST